MYIYWVSINANIRDGMITQFLYNIEKLLLDLLETHNVFLSDLKKGDLQHIYHKPSNKEYYVLWNKFCWEFIQEYKNNTVTCKLIPNQDFLLNR